VQTVPQSSPTGLETNLPFPVPVAMTVSARPLTKWAVTFDA
jgi:hypothetical protein